MSMLLEMAHKYWRETLEEGDCAIDATCGRGKDTAVLLDAVGERGRVYALDIQKEALHQTKELLKGDERVTFLHQSHATLPPVDAKVIVYNLGYLPGGEKSIVTSTETTLQSIRLACEKVMHGGLITVMCYPGHEEGAREEAALLAFAQTLSKQEWLASHHRLLNRNKAPSLLVVQRAHRPS